MASALSRIAWRTASLAGVCDSAEIRHSHPKAAHGNPLRMSLLGNRFCPELPFMPILAVLRT